MSKNKIETLTVAYKDLSKTLLPLLLGNIFHVTNGDSVKSIFEAGSVRNNQNGDFPSTFPQSNSNYGAKNGMVYLIDLRGKNYEEAQEHASNGYYFLKPKSEWKSVAFFVLSSNYFADLKHQARFNPALVGKNHIPMEKIYTGTYLPEIECWYPGDISLNKFSQIFVVNIL